MTGHADDGLWRCIDCGKRKSPDEFSTRIEPGCGSLVCTTCQTRKERTLRLVAVVADIDEQEPWKRKANCLGVDPDLFFTARGESTSEAREVCAGCQVRAECLEYAFRNNEQFGLWGGISYRERRKLRREWLLRGAAS